MTAVGPNKKKMRALPLFCHILPHFCHLFYEVYEDDSMSFFLGICDLDTINSALAHQQEDNTQSQTIENTGAKPDSTRLKQDWAILVNQFSWQKAPVGNGFGKSEAFGRS